MPIIIGVKQLLGLEYGEPVTGVRGVLKVVFKPSSFTGRDGNPGTVQSGYLKDLDGDEEVRLKVWNRDDLSDLKGEVVEFLAVSGKGGAKGLKYVESEYQGKKEPCLEVSERADMSINDGGAAGAVEPEGEQAEEAPKPRAKAAAPKRASAPAPAPKAPVPRRAQPEAGKPSWSGVGAQMRRVGAAYASALIEVVTRVAPAVQAKSGLTLDPATMHAAATTMLLSVLRDRDKLGFLPDLPWKGYLVATEQPAPQPQQSMTEEQAKEVGAEPDEDEDDIPF